MELEAYGHSKISIHALREEGDQRWQCVSVDGLGFLSTPSARRATAINLGSGAMRGDFYPRPPRGGRPGWLAVIVSTLRFLSTPSARRATQASNKSHRPKPFLSTPSARRATRNPGFMWRTSGISIHALREEGDGAVRLASTYPI